MQLQPKEQPHPPTSHDSPAVASPCALRCPTLIVALQLGFEQLGAVVVLCRWYKYRLRYPRPAKLKPEIKRCHTAVRLQCWWRTLKAVWKVRRKRRHAKARIIQRAARAYLARSTMQLATQIKKFGGTMQDLEGIQAGTITKGRLDRLMGKADKGKKKGGVFS